MSENEVFEGGMGASAEQDVEVVHYAGNQAPDPTDTGAVSDVPSSDAVFDSALVSVPAPPKGAGKGSRKRPCAKNSNRRRERFDGSDNGASSRRPNRKLNSYFLDVTTGRAVPIRPGTEVPKGARVVEQPTGHPAPSVAQFYDASLLPEGSTVIAQYGFASADLDPALVARFGRLAGLAGIGRQSRRTHLDVLARCVDSDTALRAAIVALGGESALDCDFKDLAVDPGVSRDVVAAAVATAVNAGNTSATRFTDDLPAAITPSPRLSEHLADLPGRVLSVIPAGAGSRIELQCYRFEDMQKIADALRAAGGRRIDVKRSEESDGGRPRRVFAVSGEFAASPAELAAARTGGSAELEYSIDASGRVVARYRTRLFDQTITTPDIPAEPSRQAVRALVDAVEEGFLAPNSLLSELHAFATQQDADAAPFEKLIDCVGPVRTTTEVVEVLSGLTLDDVLGAGAADRFQSRTRSVELPGRREVGITYRDGAAVFLEECYHVTDRRVLELPDFVDGPSGPTPTRVRELTFTTRKGSNRPRVVVKETPVAEIKRRRAEFVVKRDPSEAVLRECRENVLSEVTRTMAASLASAKADGRSRSIARNKHLEPVLVKDGALVALVSALAADPSFGESGATWSKWCATNVAGYRNRRVKARSEGSTGPAPEFFENLRPENRAVIVQTLEAAAQSFLSMRCDRDVSLDEVRDLAARLRVDLEDEQRVLTAFERARAVHSATHRGVSLT